MSEKVKRPQVKRVQLVKVTVRDFKKVKLAALFLNDVVTRIEGDTDQGKTSCLEAFEAAVREFCHPSMVRKDADQALIELEMDEGTVTRVIPKADEYWKESLRKWGTVAVSGPDGMAMEDGVSWLACVFGQMAFRPMEFVRLGGGDPLHRTERQRLQRNMLLQALPARVTKRDLNARFKNAPDAVLAAIKKMQLGTGVDYDAHGFQVCDALLDQCKAGLTAANAAWEQAQNVLKLAPAPEGMIPTKVEPELISEIEMTHEAYVLARGRADSGMARVKRRDVLRKAVEAGAKGLHPRGKVDAALLQHTASHEAAQEKVSEIEAEIARLHIRLVEETNLLESAKRKVNACYQAMRDIEAQEAREADLTALEAELAGEGEVEDVEALKAAWKASEEMLENRRRQDRHDVAAAAAAEAAAEAEVFKGLVKEFRDDLPSELLAKAELGIEGLVVEEDRLLVDGIPLCQFGTSKTFVLAVKLWAAMYPRCPVLPLDGGESLGSLDQEEIERVARENGFKVVMTIVKPGATPGPGVVVMKEGQSITD